IIAENFEIDEALGQYLRGHLEMNEDGTIIVNKETQMTSMEGAFAGGLAAGSCFLVSEAVASGKRAAVAIDGYIRSQKTR
ncbi:MAG: hypothetical protein PHP64_08230, partial [Actinomycetota bacterium]|nr:hypothetical protein [Actinomycetota bacterium]